MFSRPSVDFIQTADSCKIKQYWQEAVLNIQIADINNVVGMYRDLLSSISRVKWFLQEFYLRAQTLLFTDYQSFVYSCLRKEFVGSQRGLNGRVAVYVSCSILLTTMLSLRCSLVLGWV